MNNKNKIKIISYILAYITFISGTYLKYKQLVNPDKTQSNKDDFTTIETTEETTHKTEIIETIKPTEETIFITESTISIPKYSTNIKNSHKEELVTLTKDAPIYSSNSEQSLKINNLKINTNALKLLNTDNNWTLIKYNNQIGYIHNDYIETKQSHMIKEFEYIKKKDIVLTTIDYIDLKISPYIETETIKTLRINTELEVIASYNDEWLLVNINGLIGYIQKEYTISLLDKLNNQYPNLSIKELKIEKVIYSIANDLNIRTENNTECEIINQLDKYESVRVLGEYDNWYLIMTNDYNFGFISKNYTETLTGIYVIVDLSEQKVYMYNDNILYCVAPTTTGKDATPTDIGLSAIWHKDTDVEIIPGFKVNYWMIFNQSYEGLHDAENWREEYGMHTEEEKLAQNYRWNGSNGCPNLQKETAKLIYENSEIGTKVLVHK